MYVLAATQAWWQSLLMVLFQLLVQVLVPVAVTLLLYMLGKWLKVRVDDHLERKVHEYADLAVAYAEQKLRKALKEGNPPKDPNAARMQWAAEFLRKMLLDSGLMKKAGGKLEELLEARLGVQNSWRDEHKMMVTKAKARAQEKEDKADEAKADEDKADG